MRKKWIKNIFAVHLLMAILVLLVFVPGQKKTEGPWALIGAIILIELVYLYHVFVRKDKVRAASDILAAIWIVMIVWEVAVSKLDMCHPVLVPSMENIFYTFTTDWLEMLVGVVSSLELLVLGVAIGLAAGTLLGLFCGWNERPKEFFQPVATVLAPIPSVVFAPYIIALMPSFRSASVVIVILGIFWPVFLRTILSVDSMDRNIIDSARMLEMSGADMVFHILLPYSFPSIIGGLGVTMTTAVMLLTFAEMMGATVGMGYYIVNYNTYGNYTKVIAGIIVVGIVVTLINWLVRIIQKRVLVWKNY